MPLTGFDHVNIRTGRLDTMVAWYEDVLGLKSGPRAAFDFPGAWLYLGDQALVHLVGVEKALQGGGAVTLEHFAFRAAGMEEFVANLENRGIRHTINAVPGLPIVQVNIYDPDGNHIHVDFDAAEQPKPKA